MVSILPNTDSLQLGRSYTAHLSLISGATQPTASAAGDELVRAHHFISYKFPPNLLLRRPSHNYCCSGAHRTTAAPAAIALAGSSLPIFDNTVPWMLQSRLPDRACEGVIHFCGELNLSSHLQKLAKVLEVARGKQLTTKIRNFCRAEFQFFGAHSAVFTKLRHRNFVFCFFGRFLRGFFSGIIWFEAVSCEKIFPRNFRVGGIENFLGKKRRWPKTGAPGAFWPKTDVP